MAYVIRDCVRHQTRGFRWKPSMAGNRDRRG